MAVLDLTAHHPCDHEGEQGGSCSPPSQCLRHDPATTQRGTERYVAIMHNISQYSILDFSSRLVDHAKVADRTTKSELELSHDHANCTMSDLRVPPYPVEQSASQQTVAVTGG